jgi:hypothetical protein
MANKRGLSDIITLILICVEKNGSLPASIVNELIDLMNDKEDNQNREDDSMKISYMANSIIVILSRVEHLVQISSDQLENISIHLASEYAVITNEKIKFVKVEDLVSTNNNEMITLISSITSKLILANVEMTIKEKSKHMNLSARTVDHLVHALHENVAGNKQTRITAAKCLYLLSSQKQLPYTREMMSTIYDQMKSEIYDIIMRYVYMHAIYTSYLHQQSTEAAEPLEASEMENVSELFQLNENGSKGSLKLGDVKFEDIINEQVLDILEYETRKGYRFEDEKLFTLMEAILYMNNDDETTLIYTTKVLDILAAYK